MTDILQHPPPSTNGTTTANGQAHANGNGHSVKPDNNPYSCLIQQEISVIPSFTLESGVTLTDVPVAYKTWGKLNAAADNCLVICHALTGSSDVEDW